MKVVKENDLPGDFTLLISGRHACLGHYKTFKIQNVEKDNNGDHCTYVT